MISRAVKKMLDFPANDEEYVTCLLKQCKSDGSNRDSLIPSPLSPATPQALQMPSPLFGLMTHCPYMAELLVSSFLVFRFSICCSIGFDKVDLSETFLPCIAFGVGGDPAGVSKMPRRGLCLI
jgi:hypothetical protein